MKLGYRGTLIAVSILFLTIVGSTSGLYLEQRLRTWYAKRLKANLLSQAKTARLFLQSKEFQPSIKHVDGLADRLGRVTGVRVSIVNTRGQSLGDSVLSPRELTSRAGYNSRPEIRDAFRTQIGISRRYSSTVKTHMLYVAIPFQHKGYKGVVRVGTSFATIDNVIQRIRLLILFAGVVGILVALFMSLLASRVVTRSLRNILLSTREITMSGALGLEGATRSATSRGQEKEGSFNEMAQELESTITKLAQERNRFEAVLESMKAAVITYDSNQQIAIVNRSAMKILQLEVAPVGQHIFDLVNSKELLKLVKRVTSGNSASAELKLEDPLRRLLVRATPLSTTQGGIMVLHDITELRRLETVRRDFVANVSHELRTPVSIIRANAETLLDGAIEDPEFAQSFLKAMVRHAERLSNLVSDLLDISRIEAGEYQLETQKVSIALLVESARETVNAMMHNKQITLDIGLEPDLQVTADVRALEQVMLNLLDNAIKYTPEKGHLQVRAFQEGNEFVRVEVQDNGPGIPEKHRPRIFERFYRIDKGRSRHMGGTGLGLAIVKHLVDTMGGRVGLEPAEPHGSIFWFSTPVHERPSPTEDNSPEAALQVPPSTSQELKTTSDDEIKPDHNETFGSDNNNL